MTARLRVSHVTCLCCAHQEEAGTVGAQLDLGVGGEGKDGRSVLPVDRHGSTQEAAQTPTVTHKQTQSD